MQKLDSIAAGAVGVVISAVAAWYSILGLTTMFSGAFWPVLVMGTVLETGKVVTASWLYRNWRDVPQAMRAYFSAAVVVLMVVTSVGIFGYLSSAHVSGSVETGDYRARVAYIDSEIATQVTAEAAAVRQLKQLDSAVEKLIELDQVSKSVQLRQQQARDREALRTEVRRAQDASAALRTERASVATLIRRAEAEAGPVRYVSELVYGESSQEYMDRAIRMVIVLLVFAFDPLAILLIMAASYRKTSVDLPTGSITSAVKLDSAGKPDGSSSVYVPDYPEYRPRKRRR